MTGTDFDQAEWSATVERAVARQAAGKPHAEAAPIGTDWPMVSTTEKLIGELERKAAYRPLDAGEIEQLDALRRQRLALMIAPPV